MTAAPSRDDSTRTLATYAEEQAREAVDATRDIRRNVKRSNWMWGVFITVGTIFASGFALRDRLDHYATHAQVKALEESQQRDHDEIKALSEYAKAQREMTERMARQLDDIHGYFMREKRR